MPIATAVGVPACGPRRSTSNGSTQPVPGAGTPTSHSYSQAGTTPSCGMPAVVRCPYVRSGLVLVDYADLAAEPARTLRRVLACAGVAVNGDAIDEAVAATMPHGGLYGERPYAPRSIDGSRYLDRELLSAYESLIVDRLPHLGVSRVFGPVDYRDTLVRQVFEARRAWRVGDLAAALATVDGALDRWPDIGLLLHERATILQALGRLREAQADLATAAAREPVHPVILEELITVSFMLGDSEAAAGPAETLASLVEPRQVGLPERDTETAAVAGAGPSPDEPPVAPVRGPGPAPGSSSAADSDIRSQDIIGSGPPSAGKTTGGLQGDSKVGADELQEKERMIAALAAIAEERAAELQRKEDMIDALAATAEERLGLVRHLHAEAAGLRQALADLGSQRHEELRERLVAPLRREALERSVVRLRQQERVIAELTAATEERLRRIEQFAVEYGALSSAFKRLSRQRQPETRRSAGLAGAVGSKLAQLLTRSLMRGREPSAPSP